MDNLQSWEVYELYDGLKYADAASWEQTRWLMYVVAQVNSKKPLKVQDILKFPWDQNSVKTTITDSEIKKLSKKARLIQKDLFKKDGKTDIQQ